MKYNEIATPRPLQFLMVEVRNDKKGFGQHALDIRHLEFSFNDLFEPLILNSLLMPFISHLEPCYL